MCISKLSKVMLTRNSTQEERLLPSGVAMCQVEPGPLPCEGKMLDSGGAARESASQTSRLEGDGGVGISYLSSSL